MIRVNRFVHSFVNTIPEQLAPGTLYIALPYKIVTHLCCCGCGREVVTPLSPAQWRITFNGEAVSLYPSVGNWNLPCRSHYILKDGEVLEANIWTDEQVAYGQARDKRERETYYNSQIPRSTKAPSDVQEAAPGWWARLVRHLLCLKD
jgi:hypothetical protein